VKFEVKVKPTDPLFEVGGVYATTSPALKREYLMIVEDAGGTKTYERFALLNMNTGRLDSGWTNDDTILKLLFQKRLAHCPDATLHLTVEEN